MRAWVFFVLTGALLLFAPPQAFRGGVLDGVDGGGLIACALLVILALSFGGTEEKLIEEAGPMSGGWGCLLAIPTFLMWATLVSFVVWLLMGAPIVG